jgi:hypothetical protein
MMTSIILNLTARGMPPEEKRRKDAENAVFTIDERNSGRETEPGWPQYVAVPQNIEGRPGVSS